MSERTVVVERVSNCPYPIVRVLVRAEDPDFDLPWQTSPREGAGVAVVIGPRRLLTLANLVVDAVTPERPLERDQAIARIVAIDHDRDLALLEVAGSIEEMWGLAPSELIATPTESEVVVLAGFDDDGALAAGHGVVGEVQLVRYAHSQRHLLAVGVEARQPFNPGGDAVLRHGKLIGIVMQKQTENELLGELVPPPIIRAFLEAVETRRAPGVPALGISVQPLGNPVLRAHLKLPADGGGVLVTQVDHGGTCDGVLVKGDVLTTIDRHAIDDDGNIEIEGRSLKHYAALCAKHLGDRAKLGIIREGLPAQHEITLGPLLPLVPRVRHEVPPAYFVWAGLVFQTLTRDYLTTWDTWWNNGPKEFLAAYYYGQRTAETHELVVLTQIYDDEINAGYASFHNESVVAVNGRHPKDLHALVRSIESTVGPVLIETSTGGLIAIDAQEARAASARINEANGITRDRSVGL